MIGTSPGVVHLFTRCLLFLSFTLAIGLGLGLCSSFCILLSSGTAFLTYKALAALLRQHHDCLLELIQLIGIEELLASCVSRPSEKTEIENADRSVESSAAARSGQAATSNTGDGLTLEVDKYVRCIMRDFISSWYHGSISANEQFTHEIRYALEDVSVALISRARKLNPHLLLGRIVRVYHRHFLHYLKLCERGRKSDAASSDEWHVALTSSNNEIRYLQNVVNVLLEVLVPADVLVCPIGRRLVVTLLAHKLLLPAVDLLSDPDWINRKLVATLGGGADEASTTSIKRSDYNDQVFVAAETMLDGGGGRSFDETTSALPAGQALTDECRSSDAALELTNRTGFDERAVVSTVSEVADVDSAGESNGIWQRMVDELPSAFRTERQQEVSDILQEAGAGGATVVAGTPERRRHLRMPLSGSLEKISDLFTNAINVEFITGNLAHYFKLSQLGGSDEDRTVQAATSGMPEPLSCVSDDASDGLVAGKSRLEQCHHQSNVIAAVAPPVEHNVSSGLGRVVGLSTGLVMGGGRGGRLDDATVARELGLNWSEQNDSELGMAVEVDGVETSPTTYGLRSEEMTLAWKLLAGSSDPVFQVTDTTGHRIPELSSKCSDRGSSDGVGNSSPVNRTTFSKLTIPSTEVIEEPGSGGQYVAYCVQYDAWFREPESIKTFDVDSYVDIVEPCASLQTNYVRRRFREFLALQVRLEEDSQLRPQLKGIRGPNKWSVLPFNKLDKDALNERRISLERYLQLLISKDDIPNSHHMREFLAYGCDASIAYVRKINDSNLPVPRFDKFLMKTMTGVFDKLKTALPSLPHDPSPVEPVAGQNKTDRFLGFLNFNNTAEIATGSDASQLRLSFDYGIDSECVDNVEDLINQYLGNYDAGNDKVDTAYDAADIDAWLVDPWSLPSPTSPDTRVVASSEEIAEETSVELDPLRSEDAGAKSLDDSIPLASTFINFSAETIQDDDVKVDREHFVFVMKLVFGNVLEKWISDLIDNNLTEETFANCLRRMAETFWPDGDAAEHSYNLRTESCKKQTYEVALQSLKDYFPSIFVFILGPQYETGMKLFLDSFQHPKSLRNVIYQLLDLLVDSLIIRSRSQSIIDKLGSIT